jgi:hypothetical protein
MQSLGEMGKDRPEIALQETAGLFYTKNEFAETDCAPLDRTWNESRSFVDSMTDHGDFYFNNCSPQLITPTMRSRDSSSKYQILRLKMVRIETENGSY